MATNGDIQLSIGYWIVSHRQTLRAWWAIMSMAVIAFCLLWSTLFFILFFAQEGKVNLLVLRAVAGTGSYETSHFQPSSLDVGTTSIVTRDAQHVDLVADVKNPNAVWGAANVVAHFVIDGVAAPTQQVFLNQDSVRPVIQLNIAAKTTASTKAELVIDDVTWARASAAALPAPKFTVSNIHTDPSTIAGQTQSSVSVRASIMNESVYNFYKVDVPIVLYSGTRVVGAGVVSRSRWATLTSQEIDLTLGYPVPEVTRARIEPQVSRFDVSNTYR